MLLLVTLALCAPGCGKRNTGLDDGAARATPGHPDLRCPPGTVAAGFAPPVSFEVWCQRKLPDGRIFRHGPAITWHENHTKASAGSYFESKKTGMWSTWSTTGTLLVTEHFDSDYLEGRYVAYHESGVKKAEGEMHRGLATGNWVYWAESGHKEREGAFVDGEFDGYWIIYGEDGRPQTKRIYRLGRLRSQVEL